MNRQNLKNIFGVYWRNPSFLALSGFFFLSLVVSKGTYNLGVWDISEDFFTLLFVMSIWLSFEMGVLIKRQFANFRASLLPGYRQPHGIVATFLFFFFLVTVAIWRKGINYLFVVSVQEYMGITMLCLLVYLLIIFVAYVSIGRLVFICYFMLLLVAGQTQAVISFLGRSPTVSYMLLALTVAMGIYFWQRLMTLREEYFEYPFLVSWLQKDLVGGAVDTGPSFNFSVAHPKEGKSVSYVRRKGLLARALHWDCLERGEILSIVALLVVLTPFYLMYLKAHPSPESFYLRPFSNFLIFAVAPVLTTLCLTYKKMAFWNYDLLKPVGKKDLLKERGIGLAVYLAASWVIFVLYFSFVPNIYLHTPDYFSVKLWLYLILTGIYALMVLAWIALMAAMTETRGVIASGILLMALTQAEFMVMPFATPDLLAANILFASLGVWLFVRLAYRRWCAAEG